MAHCDFGKFPNVFESQFNGIASFDFKSFFVELHLIVCLYYDFLIGFLSHLVFGVGSVWLGGNSCWGKHESRCKERGSEFFHN